MRVFKKSMKYTSIVMIFLFTFAASLFHLLQSYPHNLSITEASDMQYLKDLKIGDLVKDKSWDWDFKLGGNYTDEDHWGEPIASAELKPVTWIVVAKDHYGNGSGITLLSEELIGNYTFDDSTDITLYGSNHWGDSGTNATSEHGLRPWLNSTGIHAGEGFYNAFSESFRNSVVTTEVSNVEGESGVHYATSDNVFIPSYTELGETIEERFYETGRVFDYFKDAGDTERRAKLQGSGVVYGFPNDYRVYWTRSADTYLTHNLCVVTHFGDYNFAGAQTGIVGVRPALNLSDETPVSLHPGEDGVYLINKAVVPDPGDDPGDNGDPGDQDSDDGIKRYGHVLNEDSISVADAIAVLRHIVGLHTLDKSAQKRARVSSADGSISVNDAILILRYIVGLLKWFPVEVDMDPEEVIRLMLDAQVRGNIDTLLTYFVSEDVDKDYLNKQREIYEQLNEVLCFSDLTFKHLSTSYGDGGNLALCRFTHEVIIMNDEGSEEHVTFGTIATLIRNSHGIWKIVLLEPDDLLNQEIVLRNDLENSAGQSNPDGVYNGPIPSGAASSSPDELFTIEELNREINELLAGSEFSEKTFAELNRNFILKEAGAGGITYYMKDHNAKVFNITKTSAETILIMSELPEDFRRGNYMALLVGGIQTSVGGVQIYLEVKFAGKLKTIGNLTLGYINDVMLEDMKQMMRSTGDYNRTLNILRNAKFYDYSKYAVLSGEVEESHFNIEYYNWEGHSEAVSRIEVLSPHYAMEGFPVHFDIFTELAISKSDNVDVFNFIVEKGGARVSGDTAFITVRLGSEALNVEQLLWTADYVSDNILNNLRIGEGTVDSNLTAARGDQEVKFFMSDATYTEPFIIVNKVFNDMNDIILRDENGAQLDELTLLQGETLSGVEVYGISGSYEIPLPDGVFWDNRHSVIGQKTFIRTGSPSKATVDEEGCWPGATLSVNAPLRPWDDIDTTYLTVSVPGNEKNIGELTKAFPIIILPEEKVYITPVNVKTEPGEITTFRVKSTFELESGLVYRWDFGDGGAVLETSLPLAEHAYTEEGSYNVNVSLLQNGKVLYTAKANVTIEYLQDDNDDSEDWRCGLGIDYSQLTKIEVDGRVYYVNENGIAHGLSLAYYDADREQLFQRGCHIGGYRHGLWTTWYSSGAKWSETNYSENKKIGKATTWYPNGNKETEGYYVDGMYYVDGIKEGTWYLWLEDGNLRNIGNYEKGFKHGLCTTFQYTASGYNYLEGYYENANRTGTWYFYTSGGIVIGEYNYLEDKLHGSYKNWYSSGVVQLEGQYTHGERSGTWIFYDSNGNESRREKYG